ncbi:hypothetical protein NK718_03880 [Alsobacter sp. SYSU M60028]|uniref:Uncharacterized protein n=1 Tax=Alsobacter ponti TaxID=2962936 RepID=A0ABT1L9K8_9HYPH|nr:hypothetical protein [Alsobacter ponti]MCP8937641.1 hypothetical protein [Alsobacter ponti]
MNAPARPCWHASVLRRLREAAGEPADRAACRLGALAAAFGAEGAPPGDAIWRWSRLAPGGSPVEIVWRPGRAGIGWTSEVAPPATPEVRRLDRALALAARFGFAGFDAEALAGIARAQAEGGLAWGAWLGGRHAPEGDALKLYAEIPQRAGELAGAGVRADWPETGELRMVGVSAAGVEYYWRVERCAPHVVYRAAEAVGATRLLPEAAALLGELRDAPPAEALAGPRLGLSLAFDADGKPLALSLFLGASRAGLRAPDDLRRLGRRAGDPLGGAFERLWRDGMVRPSVLGLALTAQGIGLQVGWAPCPA